MNMQGLTFFLAYKVYLPVSKLSNRMVISGLSNGQSKTSVVNMSTLLKDDKD